MSDPPSVSVIIPVYNDAARLRSCLQRLAQQTGFAAGEVEVLVVDNGSTPPLAAAEGELASILGERAGLRLLEEPQPGSYAARNRGLQAARGPILAFTDADCLPQSDWLERGVAAMRRLGERGIVGGHVELFPKREGRPNAVECFDMAANLDQAWVVRHINAAITANLMTTRATVDAVGAFDAARTTGGDIEWSQRVYRAGYPLVYEETAIVQHPARGSLAELSDKIRRFASGKRERHPLWMYTLHTLRLLILPSLRHIKRVLGSPRIHGWWQRLKGIWGAQLSRWLEARYRISQLLRRHKVR